MTTANKVSSPDLINRVIELRNKMLKAVPVRYYPPAAEHFSFAALSSVLCPRLETEFHKAVKTTHPVIYVIGNEGAYLEKKGKERWKNFLNDWGVTGKAEIHYLLLSPQPTVLPIIKALLDTAGAKGKLTFYKRPASISHLPVAVKESLERWETHHFLISKNPKALWVEGNHPAGSPNAYDCAFFNSDACEGSPDWDIYHNTVKTVWPYLQKIDPSELA